MSKGDKRRSGNVEAYRRNWKRIFRQGGEMMPRKKKTPDDWLAKYYPVSASGCGKKDALDHSILKWSGLHPHVLKIYGLKAVKGIGVVEIESDVFVLGITGSTCALCKFYASLVCNRCPPTKANGRNCESGGTKTNSPFFIWWDRSDPKPMLKWLRKAKQGK